MDFVNVDKSVQNRMCVAKRMTFLLHAETSVLVKSKLELMWITNSPCWFFTHMQLTTVDV